MFKRLFEGILERDYTAHKSLMEFYAGLIEIEGFGSRGFMAVVDGF